MDKKRTKINATGAYVLTCALRKVLLMHNPTYDVSFSSARKGMVAFKNIETKPTDEVLHNIECVANEMIVNDICIVNEKNEKNEHDLLPSAGDLKNFRILKTKYRGKASILEIDFAVNEDANKKDENEKKNDEKNDEKNNNENDVQQFSREVLEEISKDHSRSDLQSRIETVLTRLQNAAYTNGFMAGKTATSIRSHMFK